ncbi:MAG: restriction endonuclease subunit M, partial [Ignavibacteria bacterium]|nr:restriction endonuclease subunit M [Ignavibacteria bacterium]
MPPPPELPQLVERFDRNIEAYRSGQYNETQLRLEYIDPLFKALGWDVYNERGYAEAYKDVIHEATVKIGGVTRAPDYSFQIGGKPKFFLEAKRPSASVKDEIGPAYQLRRYAWSAKLPLSILTDFEEFAVYDCRIKPLKSDSAATARTLILCYKEYEEKWEQIASIFSRDAVLQGSFDRYAESTKVKKGTAEVDDAFLKEIEAWRESLAKTIALRNPKLTQRELNFAVQRTIDRIIFMRICEDRGIEMYGRLQALLNGERVYRRLTELFRRADERYNSGLFHFEAEKNRNEPPDELTLQLDIDDKPLKEILKGLYYPDSAYEFSVLPADILGQVYEQFLGKVIRLTASHRAVVEDKPEVKKAGGVYYTPTYIVDYIVKNTVGVLLSPPSSQGGDKEGVEEAFSSHLQGEVSRRSRDGGVEQTADPLRSKEWIASPSRKGAEKARGLTPRQASKLRILDPACGSGSFLIGAYQYLLDWHRDWYVNDGPEKHATGRSPALYQGPGGDWRLTTAERKRILLNNIYGVDIDPQAVEVTKLSLLLKVLEGENDQTISLQLKMFHERALPDLGSNIKCGNSLIGSDFYEGKQLSLLDEEERTRINVFDWEKEFPEIMKGGGFDAVIGNPPYVRIQGFPAERIEYFSKTYESATGNFDVYVVFVERGFALLSPRGLFGMILPNKFFKTDYGRGLRLHLSKHTAIAKIVDFGASQVFSATTYTCLLFLSKISPRQLEVSRSEANARSLESRTIAFVPAANLSEQAWMFSAESTRSIWQKLRIQSVRLLDLPADMSRGSSTGADDVFLVEKGAKLEKEALRIPLFATDFRRYHFDPAGDWRVIFPYTTSKDSARLLEEEELKKFFPKTYTYLHSNVATLRKRKQFRKWFAFSAARNLELHDRANIAVPLLADRGSFALIPQSYKGRLCPMASGGFTITLGSTVQVAPEYVLGLLNSRLLFWCLRETSNVFRGGWITCTKQYFGELPIRTINFSDPVDKSRHDKMVELVQQMLDLHKQLHKVKTEHEKTALQRQIDATDKQIDNLVYELYGLTEEEI